MAHSELNQTNSDKLISSCSLIRHDPGKIIGKHYQIIKELETEGLGITYLAKNLEAFADYQCILQQLQPKFQEKDVWEQVKENLVREALIKQRLGNHAQIPQLLAYFVENREFYLVYEFIDGEELRHEVERQPLEEAEVINLLQDVLRILDFVHKTHVIHGQLEPSHLIRRPEDGKFVLTGFGLIHTLSYFIVSTPRVNLKEEFIPPEQVAGLPVFSSDIYALGKIAIYALTGRSPRELESQQTEIDGNWQESYGISTKLWEILEKMTLPEVAERYHSAIEVLQDLQPLLQIGHIVGKHYRITAYLGGKNGIYTYLADNLWRNYQSPCVIKEIKLHLAESTTEQALQLHFANELEILQRLSYHRQIPQIWDCFEEHEVFYLVQEHIEGENLADKLEQNDNLPEEEVIDLIYKTLTVLELIHQNGMIHGNLKPSNLLIRHQDSQVLLIDFALLQEIAWGKTATKLVYSQGATEVYRPPEQIAGRPTFSSDIYALGMIAIQALTGNSPNQLLRNKETGAILWQENLQVNHRLAKILNKMINLDVGKRYQSVEQILYDLSKLNQLDTRCTTNELTENKENWLSPTYIFIETAGIITLLSTIEFFFPTLRPLYYFYQGKQLLREQPQIALTHFESAIDLQPQSAQSWKGRGDALYHLGRFPEALSAYDEAIQLKLNQSEVWQRKGEVLYYLEHFSEALTAFEHALQLDPKNIETLNYKGKTLSKLERYQAALVVQEAALNLEPNYVEALSDRGIVLISLAKYQEALADFNRVQTLEPEKPQLWQNKALALQYLNRSQEATEVYQKALAVYQKILQEQPQNWMSWLEQGEILSKLGAHQDALAAYDQAITLNPNSYLAWIGKSKTLSTLNNYNEAFVAVDRALKIRPNSELVWYHRGSLLKDGLHDLTGAIAAYDQAIELNPRFLEAWRARGFALIEEHKDKQALESFNQALSINPNDYQAWLGRGLTLFSLNRINEALAALTRVQALQPSNPSLWMKTGEVMETWGEYNKACDAYRQVMKIAPDFAPVMEAIRRVRCRVTTLD
jgi:serine/threonine protein kinase/predicted TPR repeat methyltransferase